MKRTEAKLDRNAKPNVDGKGNRRIMERFTKAVG